MKALIITMHRVNNYGSVLQTYALQKKLEGYGYQTQVVDYFPERQTSLGLMKRIKLKIHQPLPVIWMCQLVMIPSYIKRVISFGQFRKKYLNMTLKYSSVDELEQASLQADLYCTGSDQVWNYRETEGVDGAYYWSFIKNEGKKISYAASIGLETIDEACAYSMQHYLEVYDWISVREKGAVNILNTIGIRNVDWVLDPVFLFDKEWWEDFSHKGKINKKPYVLVYNIHRSKSLDKYVRKIAYEQGLDLIYIGYAYHEAIKKGKYFCAPPVKVFLRLMLDADIIVSDSFHVSAFSIIFNKNFRVFLPPNYATRISNLLEIFHLEELAVDGQESYERKKIEYSLINSTLIKFREQINDKLQEKVAEEL